MPAAVEVMLDDRTASPRETVILDGSPLRLSTLSLIGRGLLHVVPCEVRLVEVAKAYEAVRGAVEGGRQLYGVTTGVGAIKDRSIALAASADRTDLVRAAIEGTAHNLAWLLPAVEAFTGRSTGEIVFGGGAARSHGWAQVVADVLDRPVSTLADPDSAGARATALLALPEGERVLTDLRHLGELLAAEEGQRQGLDGLYAWLREMRQEGSDGDAEAVAVELGVLAHVRPFGSLERGNRGVCRRIPGRRISGRCRRRRRLSRRRRGRRPCARRGPPRRPCRRGSRPRCGSRWWRSSRC